MRLYYLGPQGTFCHEAAMRFAQLWPGKSVELVPLPSIAAVIERTLAECIAAAGEEKGTEAPSSQETVARGLQDTEVPFSSEKAVGIAPFACIPLENSIQGGVTTSWDLLGRFAVQAMHESPNAGTGVQILATHTLPIEHFLLTIAPDVELAEIQEVFSHPQALAQCQSWLSRHLSHARLTAVESTALAAAHVKEGGRRDWAGIGSRQAALAHQLATPYTCVPASEGNRTRFGLIGLPALTPASLRHAQGGRKRSLVLAGVPNRPGGLFDTLRVFAARGFNLTRIESRPSGNGLGTYVFFVDVEWQASVSGKWRQVRQELAAMGVTVAHLGLYPEV
jgi:prephenate dehydratase